MEFCELCSKTFLMCSCRRVTLPRLSPGQIGHGSPAVAVGNNGEGNGGGWVLAAVANGSPVGMGGASRGGVDCDRVSKPEI